jgi:hypothetical protein
VSVERDHHGIVVEVAAPEDPLPWAAGSVVLLIMLNLVVLASMFLVGAWGLWGLLPLLAVGVYAARKAQHVLGRSWLRLSSEYLVLEVRPLLGRPEITRVALGSIREIEREWGSLRLHVEGMGRVTIPCPARVEAEVLAALQQAMQSAPAPELRRVEAAPQTLAQLRGQARAQKGS